VKKNVSRKGAKGFWVCVFGGVFFFAALREKKCVTQRRKGAKGFWVCFFGGVFFFATLRLCVKKKCVTQRRKGAKGFWVCFFGGVFFFAALRLCGKKKRVTQMRKVFMGCAFIGVFLFFEALREKKCVTQRRKGAKGFWGVFFGVIV